MFVLVVHNKEGKEGWRDGSGPLVWASVILLALYATCSGNSHFSFSVTPEGAARFQMILLLWLVHTGPESDYLGQARLTGF